MKGSRVPPLVTGAQAGNQPILGLPSTSPLFGNAQLDDAEHSGGRFTLGLPFDAEQAFGIEGTYLFLGTRTANVIASGGNGSGSAVVGRPFIDAMTGLEGAHIVGAPLMPGGVWVSSANRLQGAELNGVRELCASRPFSSTCSRASATSSWMRALASGSRRRCRPWLVRCRPSWESETSSMGTTDSTAASSACGPIIIATSSSSVSWAR